MDGQGSLGVCGPGSSRLCQAMRSAGKHRFYGQPKVKANIYTIGAHMRSRNATSRPSSSKEKADTVFESSILATHTLCAPPLDSDYGSSCSFLICWESTWVRAQYPYAQRSTYLCFVLRFSVHCLRRRRFQWVDEGIIGSSISLLKTVIAALQRTVAEIRLTGSDAMHRRRRISRIYP